MPKQLILFSDESATPFLKWAGGKSRLIQKLRPFFPRKFDLFIEPFLGSGAIFFDLRNRSANLPCVISDINSELIACYEIVRDHVSDLIELLKSHKHNHCEDYYYEIRSQNPKDLSKIEIAARMIYLNKTCFNGLYRVNKKGYFNVPIGNYNDPKICEIEKLIAASRSLQNVELLCADFDHALKVAKSGDFVYLDPPYPPKSRTANFTQYSPQTFGRTDQMRLAKTFERLDRLKCRVMMSNADDDLIRSLYKNFNICEIKARRSISAKTTTRGEINEIIILNYDIVT